MFCSISGEVPSEPVVSKLSGHVFEKRLILKYIAEDGKCPVTNVALTESDLLELKANKAVKPRTLSSTSIPGLLASFQNEWDEVMLETFTLKQHLDTTRQELAQALYQYDAACRVVARLMKERDEARLALNNIQATAVAVPLTHDSKATNGHQQTTQPHDDSMQVDSSVTTSTPGALSADVIAAIDDACKALTTDRRGRKPKPMGALSVASIQSLSEKLSVTPHKTDKGGVTALALQSVEGAGAPLLLSGGSDKTAILSNRDTGAVVARLAEHSKRVTDVAFHPKAATIFTSSADKTVKVWSARAEKRFESRGTSSVHSAAVTSVAVHPTGDYLVSASLDGSWAILDVASGLTCLRQVRASDGSSETGGPGAGGTAVLGGRLHPDGLILATSLSTSTGALSADDVDDDSPLGVQAGATTTNVVKIWDIRQQSSVAVFADHAGPVSSNGLQFSENGYYLATGSADGNLRVWDLRKLQCVKTIDVGSPVTSVGFDYSGLYLAAGFGSAGGYGVEVYSTKDKNWGSVKSLSSIHLKAISALAWSRDSRFLVTGSLDRSIKGFGTVVTEGIEAE